MDPAKHQAENHCPYSHDCVHALHCLQASAKTSPPDLSLGADAVGSETLALTFANPHRRIEIDPTDWRYQIVQIDGDWWVKRAGAYKWPQHNCTAPETPVLLVLFPMVDWAFVFVDDFCSLLRSILASPHACALLATLLALGTPLS